jgi:hypothetical protein
MASTCRYRMVALVEQILALHKQLPEAGTLHEKTALQRRIDATDGQIDGGPAVRSDRGGDRDSGRKCSLREYADYKRRKGTMDLIYLDYNCFQRRFDDPSCMRMRPCFAPSRID